MALADVADYNFDQATRTFTTIGFDGETDGSSAMDFPHFSTLAQNPKLEMPYRSAYCMRVDLSISSTTARLNDSLNWDVTLTNTKYVRFMFFLSDDVTMANTDEFLISRFFSNQVEGGFYVNYTTANGYRMGMGHNNATTQYQGLTLGEWHTLEMKMTPAAAACEVAGWLDGVAFTTISGSTSTAGVGSGVLGVMELDAGTTKGIVLYDECQTSLTQLYPLQERWPNPKILTHSGHAFVGPGRITNVTLLSGSTAADSVVEVFDTDEADINDHTNIVARVQNSVAAGNETVDAAGMPVNVKRGAYVTIAGSGTTSPRAIISFENTPAWGSVAAVRNYGLMR
jgi:hypothetical protein